MKEQFTTINFKPKSLAMLENIQTILLEYEQQNIKITLRQLYYQLVAKDLIKNTEGSYKSIASLVTNARYTGLIDWGAIEDRTRIPDTPHTFEDIPNLLKVAINSYELDRWVNQEYYIELWTEKDAISSVILPITSKYQVTMNVNRGYTSTSSIYGSRNRFIYNSQTLSKTKKGVILYLGDFDPSGLDMDRDIQNRLKSFNTNIEFKRIGLTKEQIDYYKPPPNAVKKNDSRAKEYYVKYGVSHCWEVDALNPKTLQELIKNSILEYLNLKKFELVQEQEVHDIKRIEEFSLKFQ